MRLSHATRNKFAPGRTLRGPSPHKKAQQAGARPGRNLKDSRTRANEPYKYSIAVKQSSARSFVKTGQSLIRKSIIRLGRCRRRARGDERRERERWQKKQQETGAKLKWKSSLGPIYRGRSLRRTIVDNGVGQWEGRICARRPACSVAVMKSKRIGALRGYSPPWTLQMSLRSSPSR